MRKILLMILALLFTGLCTGCRDSFPINQKPVPKLSLTLSFDKHTYHAEETIQAKLILENVSAEEIVVKKRMTENHPGAPEPYRDVSLDITTPSGEKTAFVCFVSKDAPSRQDFVILAPGETLERQFDLDCYQIDQSGRYVVRAHYFNQSDPGDERTAWKGELVSNEATFKYEP